jgi:hypothetical protein
MAHERTITSISINVAMTIASRPFFEFDTFLQKANHHHYIHFTHQNFFYSYPDFGKQWPNGKMCEFHRVHTQCHVCSWQPERNYGGYGTIFLLNNGISENTKGRMLLLCPNHVHGYTLFTTEKKLVTQLQLF